MKTSHATLGAAFALSALTGCGPVTLYEVAASGPAAGAGVPYVLPKTILAVEVDVTESVRKKGKYAKYNAKLGFPTVSLKDGANEVEKLVKHTTSAVRGLPLSIPDETQRFVIRPKVSRKAIKRGLSFDLTEEGRLTGSESSFQDRRLDTAFAVLEGAATIAGAVMGFGAIGSTAAAVSTPSVNQKGELKEEDYQTACQSKIGNLDNDEQVVICHAATRMTTLLSRKDQMVAKTAGNIQADTFAAQLAATSAEIEALKALFFISEKKTVRTWKLYVEPGGSSSTCLSVNEATGKVAVAANCDGADVTINLPVGNLSQCAALAESGLVYRMPKEASFEITSSAKQYVLGRAKFPQFGVCATALNKVPANSGKLVVQLSAETGMLTKMSFESDTNYSDAISKSKGSVTQLVDAGVEVKKAHEEKLAQAKADALQAEVDAVARKKRELELREIQRQIDCYEQTSMPCPEPASSEE